MSQSLTKMLKMFSLSHVNWTLKDYYATFSNKMALVGNGNTPM